MRRLRHASTRRLTAIAAATAALVLTAGIAQATLTGSAPVPAPKALANAILDAFNAPEPDGVTARIHFTNKLLASGSLPGQGASPLAAGADGRLWIAKDGRFRLELQSDAGDAQIVSDGKIVTVYDSTSNTVYRATLPAEATDASKPDKSHEKLTLDKIQKTLDRLAKYWTVSGADPTSTAGQPTYTVRVSPKDDGGLLGAAEVAWDAVRGAPLRVAVYAQGQSDPVLELKAEEISYGAVSDSDVSATPPAGAKVTDLSPKVADEHSRSAKGSGKHTEVTGVDAVQRSLDFKLTAPDELAGLPRKETRLVDVDGEKGALSIYGEGMGAIAVFQHTAEKAAAGKKKQRDGELRLPEINIDGATGSELATALGTVVTFERDGISYVVAGSVAPVAAENAARGLK